MRGTSLALVSPLSRPTLSNQSPALLLSPLSLLSLLDVIPTGPLARSPASSTPPRALSAFPGSSLDTPASPTRRHSQLLTPLSYCGLEPLLRHASPRPPPRLRAHSALCMRTPSTFVCIPSAVNIPALDVAHPRRLAPPVPSFSSNVNRPLDSIRSRSLSPASCHLQPRALVPSDAHTASTRRPPPHLTNPLVLVASTISVRTLGTLQAYYLEPLNSAPSTSPLSRAERRGRSIDAFARALAQDAPSLRPFKREQRGRDSPGGRERGWMRTMDGGGGQTWVGMDDDNLTCSSRSPSTFDTKTPDIQGSTVDESCMVQKRPRAVCGSQAPHSPNSPKVNSGFVGSLAAADSTRPPPSPAPFPSFFLFLSSPLVFLMLTFDITNSLLGRTSSNTIH
ncbi:hypothetical protein HETIRDRAFT_455797 [Heterobasidion irregulare TC 32-1]|uniref:Uncharacterized protein n=1 Tax=Heterobasidion irregulare (strain TC 32-1) TaxID=747525 RepID=W4JNH9_HETIT|nr:uncharacterized protein HETIRDRAFT_455797 [Heterobasidion irregulare TC 32-1]ETW75098.1 hypothetical protein HETIRDRAFT_455797 [Heterobasidion irregulare TC 32-1]